MAVDRPTVAVLSPGEMGSRLGQLLREAGFPILTTCAGRSEGSLGRAQAAGFEVLPEIDDVVRRADLVISVVPSLSALPLAQRVAEAMDRQHRRLLFFDVNSIGPETAKRIGEAIEKVGGEFVDGSIIGNAEGLPGGGVFYLSGAWAGVMAGHLNELFQTCILGGEAGQASAFKVLYAGLTKSMASLGFELLAGAERLGLREALLEKYRTGHPGVWQFFHHSLPGYPSRSGRRSEEMVELAEALEGLGLSANMAHGSQQTLAQVAARYKRDGGADGDDLDAMITWWARAEGQD